MKLAIAAYHPLFRGHVRAPVIAASTDFRPGESDLGGEATVLGVSLLHVFLEMSRCSVRLLVLERRNVAGDRGTELTLLAR